MAIINKVYFVEIENPLTDEVKVRAVFSTEKDAMKAYKDLEKVFTDPRDPLGLQLSVTLCRPNLDNEFVPVKRMIKTAI